MPHILMIATGGTIACCETAHGLSPALDSAALLGALPELSALCTVETLDLMQLDSTDVTAADRQRMAQAVWQNREKFDGFVLCGRRTRRRVHRDERSNFARQPRFQAAFD